MHKKMKTKKQKANKQANKQKKTMQKNPKYCKIKIKASFDQIYSFIKCLKKG